MLKTGIAAIAVLMLAACNQFGGKAMKQNEEKQETHPIVGAYGKQRAIEPHELELFRAVTAELDGVRYEPETVARQVVAGTNYRFICKAVTATREPQTYQAEVVIYKPLPGKGEPTITSIKRL